jgi:GTP-binding protein
MIVSELPRVAVVGRPNVGKSSLVNRIVGQRAAIVEERPGVTRDRRELVAEWSGRSFVLVDTGGWLRPGEAGLTREPPALAAKVTAQAEAAIDSADLVLLVVDVTTGITEEDARVARVLQRADVPAMLVVNKVDSGSREPDIHEFARLGLGDPWPVSAIHGRLSGELLDAVIAALPEPPGDAPASTEDDGIFSVAIVGRPNVGKSTLFNRLVGEERSVVHDLPGTTRDAIDTVVETDEGPLRFVDTAGLRRKSQIDEPSEYYSLVRALEAIDRADAALFLIDASEGVTNQDQRLAERVDAAGSAVVLVLNKWDLLDAEQRAKVREQVADKLGFIAYAPALPISALTGKRVHNLLPALRDAEGAYHARIPTGALNRVLRDAQAAHPPAMQRRHRPRVLYATQGATDPPTFTLFATRALTPQYLRYLERKLRESFDLGPTPIKMRVRLRNE